MSRKVSVDLDLQGVARVVGVLNPSAAQDAATKAYVDATLGGWSYLTLASNFANSTVTPTDVTGMLFAMAINTKYEVEVFGVYQSAATTTGFGMSFSAPASATVYGYTWSVSTTSGGLVASHQTASPDAAAITGTTVAASANIFLMGKYVISTGGAAGNAQLRWRSEIATSAVTLQGGQFFLKYRIIP